jgi:hypothetical protein
MVKPNREIKLNKKPMDGHRKIKWNVSEKCDHQTLNIIDGLGNSVTLLTIDEMDKLYDILSGILTHKNNNNT